MRLRQLLPIALLALLAPAGASADFVYDVDFTQSVGSRPGGFISVKGTITLRDLDIRDPREYSLIFSNDLGASTLLFNTTTPVSSGNSSMSFNSATFSATASEIDVVTQFPGAGWFIITSQDRVNVTDFRFIGNGTSFDRVLTFGGETAVVNVGPDRRYLLGTTAAVPEPGGLALMGSGVLGVLGYGWRRRRG